MQINEFLNNLKNVKGGPSQYTARCPAHDDGHNSLSVAAGDGGRILIKCHAGCSMDMVLEKLRLRSSDLFAEENARVRVVTNTLHTHNTINTQNTQNTEITDHTETTHITVYPYEDSDGNPIFEVVRLENQNGGKTFRQRRRVGGSYVYKLGGVEPVLYHLTQIRRCIEQGTGLIALCEGEKDADALMEIGITATTAPMGAGKWRPQYTQQLYNAQHVYIIPDNDKPGRAHALTAGRALTEAGITVSIIDLAAECPGLPLKGDAYDALAILGASAFKALFGNAVELEAFAETAAGRDEDELRPQYVFESAERYIMEDFYADLRRQRSAERIKTGFKSLDAQLDGHLYPGLYVIGSVSSLGKTALCLQMADYIAAHQSDVLFFTLEMPRVELLARSLVREMMLMNKGSSDYNIGHILYGRADQNLMNDVIAVYASSIGRHLALIEGSFDMDAGIVADTARRHVRATGRRPVVFVDYLQILRPADPRMSDKQAVDFNVITLKRLSRELNIPVVVVSSFNRQNYAEEVNMSAFKESGAIEYSADFVMGLQARGISAHSEQFSAVDDKRASRTVMNETKLAKQQDPRPLEAIILKNRRGPAWARFNLDFYPRQNLFLEG